MNWGEMAQMYLVFSKSLPLSAKSSPFLFAVPRPSLDATVRSRDEPRFSFAESPPDVHDVFRCRQSGL